jgi:hypothetical protein
MKAIRINASHIRKSLASHMRKRAKAVDSGPL